MGKIFEALEKAGHETEQDFTSDDAHSRSDRERAARQPKAVKVAKPVPPSVPPETPQKAAVHAFIKDDLDPDLICYFKPQSYEAEKIKVLRTSILFPEQGTPPRSILVTSAFPGEGKTFIASNLAISIAQGIEEHVLLMDCDMRRSSVHSRFGFGSVPGLAEYLAKGTPIDSLLLKSTVPKLSILPGGRNVHNPAELLSSRRMANLIDELSARYPDRYVIIDSPPPLLTAEANAIARQVDGIVLVVKYGQTPRKAVVDMMDDLSREKIVGVALNWVAADAMKYYGYSGNYRHYYDQS